ncbi:MAG: helix-turn-helix transcriptional regulator [Trueperaceae bacterium]|nr:MAG: helix-turn-helix transcriptional regulator [Trueperaceae bacterium]
MLELVYSYYTLVKTPNYVRPTATVTALAMIAEHHRELIEQLRDFFIGRDAEQYCLPLFYLAAELGYAKDRGVERFIEDLLTLPERLPKETPSKMKDEEHYRTLEVGIEWLHSQTIEFQHSLTNLWGVLRPYWEREGRKAVLDACASFRTSFETNGDVLAALPAHHFSQFEAAAKEIQRSQERGIVVVIPLYFAEGGRGFNLALQESHFIGYGIEGESLFEQTKVDVGNVALCMKAFSDPTRLLLLHLIASYSKIPLSVGDLALQLGVSQPTVSGHLRLLRESNIVELDKRGNKAFHRVNTEMVKRVLTQLQEIVTR